MRVLCLGKVKDNKKVPDFVKNRVLFSCMLGMSIV